MTSERQKAAGFPLPSPIEPTGRVCVQFFIPDAEEYRAAVRGHIHQLGKWWMWEKSYQPFDERAKTAAELMRLALYETLKIGDCGDNMDCCGDLIQNLQTVNQTLVDSRAYDYSQTTTSGAITTAVTNLMNTYYSTSTPETVIYARGNSPDIATNYNLCQVIGATVRAIIAAAAVQSDQRTTGAGVLGLVAGVVAVLAAPASGGLSLLAVAGAGAAAGFSAAAIGSAAISAALADAGAINEVGCWYYSRLKDERLTFETFETAFTANHSWSASNASLVGDAIRTAMQDTETAERLHAGFLNMLNQEYTTAPATANNCAACDNCGPYDYNKDFSDGSTYLGDAKIVEGKAGFEFGFGGTSGTWSRLGDSATLVWEFECSRSIYLIDVCFFGYGNLLIRTFFTDSNGVDHLIHDNSGFSTVANRGYRQVRSSDGSAIWTDIRKITVFNGNFGFNGANHNGFAFVKFLSEAP